MTNTKDQLQKGTTKVQAGAQQVASSVTAAAQAAALSAAQLAAQQAQQAAHQAQQAAADVNSRVRAGTLSARGWVAPRLESAADYTTSTAAPAVSEAVVKNVAPHISDALRSTARRVSPPGARSRSRIRSTVAWTSLVATVLAAAGAAGALAWRRYRAAMAADTEPDVAPGSAGDREQAAVNATQADGGTADGSSPEPGETDASKAASKHGSPTR